jgi:hypothetical protein
VDVEYLNSAVVMILSQYFCTFVATQVFRKRRFANSDIQRFDIPPTANTSRNEMGHR